MNYLTYLTVFDKLTKSQQDTLTSSAFVRKFSKTLQRHIGALHRTRNGKRKADAKKQGNQHFYHNVEKAAVDRAGMERAALDYIARHRYGSARW